MKGKLTDFFVIMKNIMKYGIGILFGIVVGYLFLLSAFATTKIDSREFIYLVKDSALLNILVAILILFSLVVLINGVLQVKSFINRVNRDPKFYAKCKRVLLIAYLALGVCYVLSMRVAAREDQAIICGIADDWTKMKYTSFQPGEYIDVYPHQLGLVFLIYVVSLIFGSGNYLVFQLINVLGAVLILKSFVDISDTSKGSPIQGLAIIVSGFLFLPLLLYTTFVYGNVLGLTFSLLSVKHLLRLANEESEKKVLGIIAVVGFALLAVMIKNNYLIFIIGELCFILYLLLKKRSKEVVLLFFLILMVALGNAAIVSGLTKMVTGQTPGKGVSKWAFVAMGLQDKKENGLHDGWWNHYNTDTYSGNGYDADLQAEECKENIQERLKEFKEDPAKAIRFFGSKNASQWNNPDFQGFMINQHMGSEVNHAPLIAKILSVKGANALNNMLNYYQFLVLLCVVIYLLFRKEKSDIFVFYAVTVIGGFVFHSFWEAKSEYTISYFILLLPMFVEGLSLILSAIWKFLNGIKEKQMDIEKKLFVKLSVFAIASVVVMAIVGSGKVPALCDTFMRYDDTEAWQEYQENHDFIQIMAGNYRIGVSNGEDFLYLLVDPPEKVGQADIMLTEDVNCATTVNLANDKFNDSCCFAFGETRLAMDIPGGNLSEGQVINAYQQHFQNNQKWNLLESEKNGEYYIVKENMALTLDTENGTLMLSEFDKRDTQHWKLSRIK